MALPTPLLSSLSALKLQAATEKETKALAAMQASIDLQHQHVAPIDPPVVLNAAPSSTVEHVLTVAASSPPAPPKSTLTPTPPSNEPATTVTHMGCNWSFNCHWSIVGGSMPAEPEEKVKWQTQKKQAATSRPCRGKEGGDSGIHQENPTLLSHNLAYLTFILSKTWLSQP